MQKNDYDAYFETEAEQHGGESLYLQMRENDLKYKLFSLEKLKKLKSKKIDPRNRKKIQKYIREKERENLILLFLSKNWEKRMLRELNIKQLYNIFRYLYECKETKLIYKTLLDLTNEQLYKLFDYFYKKGIELYRKIVKIIFEKNENILYEYKITKLKAA